MRHSSFLPQDKVSEFAAMSPQQLLRETQRAAGDKSLSKWHATLIEHGKTLNGVQAVRRLMLHSADRTYCNVPEIERGDHAVEPNEGAQRGHRTRRSAFPGTQANRRCCVYHPPFTALCDSDVLQIALLKLLIPTRIYDEMRTAFQKIKLQQRQQHKLVSLLKEKNAPAHAKLKYVFARLDDQP